MTWMAPKMNWGNRCVHTEKCNSKVWKVSRRRTWLVGNVPHSSMYSHRTISEESPTASSHQQPSSWKTDQPLSHGECCQSRYIESFTVGIRVSQPTFVSFPQIHVLLCLWPNYHGWIERRVPSIPQLTCYHKHDQKSPLLPEGRRVQLKRFRYSGKTQLAE